MSCFDRGQKKELTELYNNYMVAFIKEYQERALTELLNYIKELINQ